MCSHCRWEVVEGGCFAGGIRGGEGNRRRMKRWLVSVENGWSKVG